MATPASWKYSRIPSQIVTTFGSYATAPTRMIGSLMGSSEERQAGQGPADEVLEVVDGGRHDPARAGVAEEALDGEVLREGRAAAGLHREVRDLDRRLDGREPGLQHVEGRRLRRLLDLAEGITEQGAALLGAGAHPREARPEHGEVAQLLARVLEARGREM